MPDRGCGLNVPSYASARADRMAFMNSTPVGSIESVPAARQGPGNGAAWAGLRSKRAISAALFVILSLALALRLYGINWDQGGLFHPDERAILSHVVELRIPTPGDVPRLFDADESPWNPGWFNYGSLPLYGLKVVQAAASPFTDWDIFDLRIPGRVMSAVADVLVVWMLFLFGRAWLGTRVGILAALLGALSVIGIQLSHFFAVDTILTLFIIVAAFFSIRVAHAGRRRDSVLAGLFIGLAMATKVSAFVLVGPLLVAHLIFALSERGDSFQLEQFRPPSWQRLKYALKNLLIAGAIALAAMLIAQPYMLLDFQTFKDNVLEQSGMVRRELDYPYTRQYIDTPRYLYQFWQLGTYGLGPVAGMLAWGGLVSAGVYAYLKRRKVDLVILAWLVPYLLITGWFEVKFMRYLLPAAPFLILYGARLAWWGFDWLWQKRWKLRYLGPVAIGLLVATTAHYAIAYEGIYTRPHPAQSASEWLRNNARPQSLILKEHWEEGIPNLPGVKREELELYNPDGEFKFTRISGQLARGDYLVLYSKRLYATIPRLPDRYPVSAAYYEKLFDGSLGYRLVEVKQSIPSALGIAYDEDTFGRTPVGPPARFEPVNGRLATLSFGWADESFSVYDHPKTLIFQNVDRLDENETFSRLWAARAPPEPSLGLMLSDDDAAVQVAGGTFSSIVQLPGRVASVSWLVWLLAVELIGFLALPLCLVLFGPLAGRGYLLSKILGLLIVSFAAWLMASIGVMDFSRASVIVAMLILAAISALVGWRRREELTSFIRENMRLILVMEALFLVAFLAFLAVRVANPDLWHPFRGGEKPMDFAYLNAVTRSTVMPPYDPWFAGGFLNYYYFGQFVVASLIRLTGVVPAVAYNLAVPMLFALTAGAAFAIVYALAEGARRTLGGAVKGPVLAGIGAAVLVGVAANIDGLFQVAQGAWRALFLSQPFGTFDYWQSSRMFASGSPGNEITEFPFFTFLFADLHAHLIAIPFTLLALGLGISLFLGAWSGRRRRLELWTGVIVLGLTVGALRIMNAWDFPTYLLLGVVAIVGGELLGARGALGTRIVRAVALASLMAVISHVAYLPFHQNFELFNNGVVASQTRTPLWRYWAIHAPFLFLILSYIVWRGRRVLPAAMSRLGLSPEWLLLYMTIPATFGAAAAIIGYATVVFAILTIAAILGLVVIGLASPTPRLRYELVIAGMAVVALAIGAGVDILTVNNDIGRMNTVFKFYLQAWILMSLASAYIAWRLASSGAFSLRRLSVPRGAWMTVAAVLVIAIMIYPVLGTRARLRDRFNTDEIGIDGMAFMNLATNFYESTPIALRHDLEAIRWLQDNVEGSPVIVEGLTKLYRWGNRVSIYTGLPTVVGWDWHQRQQRVDYDWAVTQRRRDVDRIYSTPDPETALRLMKQYGARYLYVGELEEVTYPAVGVAKFARMESMGLLPIYTNEKVTIYELLDRIARAGTTGESGEN